MTSRRSNQAGFREHERTDSDWNDLRDAHGIADVNEIQVTYIDAVHRDDFRRDLKLLFEDTAQGLGHIYVQNQEDLEVCLL